jgi:hypothetical protein
VIDANDIERMAKERPDECFLKGSGILKLTGAIRELERQNAELERQLAASADKTAAIVQPVAQDAERIAHRIAELVVKHEVRTHSAIYTLALSVLKNCSRGSVAPQPQAAQSEEAQKVWLVLDEQGYPNHCASWPEACHEHINDAISDHDIEEAARWTVRSATLDPRPTATDAALAQAGKEKPVAWYEKPLTRCAASRGDGECFHTQCPQLRDGEPKKSGRHCPLDTQEDGDE